MLPPKTMKILASAAVVSAGLSASVPAASSGSYKPADGQVQYLPLQSISYEFGSKFMSGYFVAREAQCAVTLMIIDKSDPDVLPPTTAARVRLMLYPGQIAGLDSEEGRSLNLTCSEGASNLLVDVGARDALVARQTLSAQKALAKAE